MDSDKLAIAVEFVENRLPDAYSLLVVKNGYLVFEKYYSPGNPGRYAVIHSVTKSVMSALIGIALDRGYLKNKDKYFVAPLTAGAMLIKENGQWKFYGNQIR